jgi:hypothetical protein
MMMKKTTTVRHTEDYVKSTAVKDDL